MLNQKSLGGTCVEHFFLTTHVSMPIYELLQSKPLGNQHPPSGAIDGTQTSHPNIPNRTIQKQSKLKRDLVFFGIWIRITRPICSPLVKGFHGFIATKFRKKGMPGGSRKYRLWGGKHRDSPPNIQAFCWKRVVSDLHLDGFGFSTGS